MSSNDENGYGSYCSHTLEWLALFIKCFGVWNSASYTLPWLCWYANINTANGWICLRADWSRLVVFFWINFGPFPLCILINWLNNLKSSLNTGLKTVKLEMIVLLCDLSFKWTKVPLTSNIKSQTWDFLTHQTNKNSKLQTPDRSGLKFKRLEFFCHWKFFLRKQQCCRPRRNP